MTSWLRQRRSAITFDLGAAGIRAYQLQQRGGRLGLCDGLQLDRTPSAKPDLPAALVLDPAQLSRLVGQGQFSGLDVALVVSPPEAQFFPMRLPEQAMTQTPDRIAQVLKWEVARESRSSAESLEVRYWHLPAARGQQPNVMAVVLPSNTTLDWWDRLARQKLMLARIDVSPCALVRLCRSLWTPADSDLWGVLDLGLRHSTLTVVVGTVPTYIRSLSTSANQWTEQLAAAFEVSYPVAEQLKREHGVEPGPGWRGRRAPPGAAGQMPPAPADAASAITGVLRESLQVLVQEIGRCFAYVMQGYPECSVSRLLLAGGGAAMRGLPALLEAKLEVPVGVLGAAGNGEQGAANAGTGKTPAPSDESPTPASTEGSGGVAACKIPVPLDPRAATAIGGALLDLETARPARSPAAAVNLVPVKRLHARVRARRRAAWIVSCSAAATVCLAGWSLQHAAERSAARVAEGVRALEIQRAEVQRRVVAVGAQRGRLLERLQLLAAARRPQPWPARLVALAAEAPDGVFLTAIQIELGEAAAGAPPVGYGQDTGTAPPPALEHAARNPSGVGRSEGAPQPPATLENRTVRLLGYAEDHAALLQFHNVVQRLPGWQKVELVRAAQEPFRAGQAVAFEMRCSTVEVTP